MNYEENSVKTPIVIDNVREYKKPRKLVLLSLID